MEIIHPKDTREPTLKELPTKELKQKRNYVRREAPPVQPPRLRLKNITSFKLNSEADVEKCSDRSVSTSPETKHATPPPSPATRQLYSPISPAYISSYNSSPQGHYYSAPSSSNINESYHDSYLAFHFPPSNYVKNGNKPPKDDDKPLDMRMKRLPPKETPTPNLSRACVIRYASGVVQTKCNCSNVMCPANVSDAYNSETDVINYSTNNYNRSNSRNVRPGHRREIVAGSCDPVIDEHFRRSLGTDYQHIFRKPSNNNVSFTVDDHFAKALGDTWYRIQENKGIAVNSISSTHSSNSQLPSFILQAPEIQY